MGASRRVVNFDVPAIKLSNIFLTYRKRISNELWVNLYSEQS